MNHHDFHEFHDPCAVLKQVTPAVKRQVVSLTLVELENLTRPRSKIRGAYTAFRGILIASWIKSYPKW